MSYIAYSMSDINNEQRFLVFRYTLYYILHTFILYYYQDSRSLLFRNGQTPRIQSNWNFQIIVIECIGILADAFNQTIGEIVLDNT